VLLAEAKAMSYMQYNRTAAEFQEIYEATQRELTRLTAELYAGEEAMEGRVFRVHELSASVTTRNELNTYLSTTYIPLSMAHERNIAKHHALRNDLENIMAAMMAQVVIDDPMAAEKQLIAEVKSKVPEEYIRSKIGSMRVYDTECEDAPSFFEEGSIASIAAYTGGRTMAVTWYTPAIVLKRLTSDNKYVVCIIDEHKDDDIDYRVIGMDCMRGPPKDGMLMYPARS
jgi:hypothetical protein